jgi:hypothetical protein
MTKKWIAINLLLLVVTGLLGWRLRDSIRQFDAENDLSKIQPVRDLNKKAVQEKAKPQLTPAKNYLPAEFAIIPERNVFSLSRTKEEKPDSAAVAETPPLTQKPILVGVIISDNQPKALIIDPGSSPQERNRRAQTKRIGDVYQGYTITSIDPDRMVLESGTRREIIPLHEGSKRPQGGKTTILATRVVSIGGGGGVVGGATPVTVVAGSPGTPATVMPARAPITIVQPATLPERQAAAAAERARQQAQQAQQEQQAQQQRSGTGTGTGTGTSSQGTRVIRTPFGDIIRPAKD